MPTGFEIVTLNRVLHDHDDEHALRLLRAVRAATLRTATSSGGRLLLTEPMADTPGAEAMGHAYFGMYLWAMGRGRSRSAQTITAMLKSVGFTHIKELKTSIPLQARILIAS